MKTELYFIRHGEPEGSLACRHTGRSDVPLSTHGEAMAHADRLIARLTESGGRIALFSHEQFGQLLAARWIGLQPRKTRPGWHNSNRVGWLGAAVLGANDGVVATVSLVVGVTAAGAEPGNVLMTGIVGLVAGTMTMVADEYVSVHSQADTEKACLPLSSARAKLANAAAAKQSMDHHGFGTHAREQLGRGDVAVFPGYAWCRDQRRTRHLLGRTASVGSLFGAIV